MAKRKKELIVSEINNKLRSVKNLLKLMENI